MQLSDILAAVSLPKQETRFNVLPKGTFLVWLDEASSRGDDAQNRITEHSVSFEVYAYAADAAAEQEIEALLDSQAIEYHKYARAWLENESLYMTAYDFAIIEKQGGRHA